jgi:hypothetical protein
MYNVRFTWEPETFGVAGVFVFRPQTGTWKRGTMNDE